MNYFLKKYFLSSCVWFGLFLNALTLLLGNLKYRFLMHDQLTFTYEALSGYYYNTDSAYHRNFHALLQGPALKISQWLSPGEYTGFFLRGVGLTYWAFPLLSLAFCFYLLKNYKKEHLFYFVLLSFSLVSMGALPNVGGLVADNLNIFWPCLILVCFSRRFELAELLMSLCGVFIFCFSHESSILLLAFLLPASILRSIKDSEGRDYLQIFQCAALLGVFWIAYGVLNPNAGTSQYFVLDLLRPWSAPRLVSLCLLLMLCGFVLCKLLGITRLLRISLAIVSIVGAYYFFQIFKTSGSEIFWGEVRARTTAEPLALLIAIVAFVSESYSDRWSFSNWAGSSPAAIFMTFCLIFSATCDFLSVRNWEKSLGVVSKFGDFKQACIVMSEMDYQNKVGYAGTNISTYVLLSILMQKSKAPSHILFIQGDRSEKVDYCCELLNRKLNVYGHDQRELPAHYFDFDPLISQMKKELPSCKFSSPSS